MLGTRPSRRPEPSPPPPSPVVREPCGAYTLLRSASAAAAESAAAESASEKAARSSHGLFATTGRVRVASFFDTRQCRRPACACRALEFSHRRPPPPFFFFLFFLALWGSGAFCRPTERTVPQSAGHHSNERAFSYSARHAVHASVRNTGYNDRTVDSVHVRQTSPTDRRATPPTTSRRVTTVGGSSPPPTRCFGFAFFFSFLYPHMALRHESYEIPISRTLEKRIVSQRSGPFTFVFSRFPVRGAFDRRRNVEKRFVFLTSTLLRSERDFRTLTLVPMSSVEELSSLDFGVLCQSFSTSRRSFFVCDTENLSCAIIV